jgi:hypothetical protein
VRGALRAGSVCLALLLLWRGPAVAADGMAAPTDVQVPLLLKALAYDRNVEEKARGDILVGLLYRPDDVESEAAARSVAKLIAGYPTQKISDLPVYYRLIPYEDEAGLANIVREEWVDVVYIAPGLRASLSEILRVTAEGKVLSMTGVTSYVLDGVTMGIEKPGNRAEMIINLASAQNEGSRFSGQFLSLCNVIREKPGAAAPAGRPDSSR